MDKREQAITWLHKLILTGLLQLLLTPMLQAETFGLSSPLPERNLYPPMMRFYDPIPDNAFSFPGKGVRFDLNTHYASLFQFDALPNGQLLVDMELLVTDIVIKKSYTDRLELSLRLPLLLPNSGIFDAVVQDFHKLFHMPNGGRHRRPNNRHAYHFNSHWNGSPQAELGNIVVAGKYRLINGRNWALAGLAAIKIPTAAKSRGWGSGAADLAAGAVLSWQNTYYFAHIEGWIIHPFASNESGLSYRSYARGSITTGWKFSKKISALLQTQGGLSPYRSTIPQLDHPPFLISLGLKGKASNSLTWSTSFTENITQKTTQDFSITAGLNFSY